MLRYSIDTHSSSICLAVGRVARYMWGSYECFFKNVTINIRLALPAIYGKATDSPIFICLCHSLFVDYATSCSIYDKRSFGTSLEKSGIGQMVSRKFAIVRQRRMERDNVALLGYIAQRNKVVPHTTLLQRRIIHQHSDT